MPGPPPKRSDQRRRHADPTAGPPTKATVDGAVRVPRGDRKWHPIAKRWYDSLAKSGQSRFYEPSDWATAYLIAESMSQELKPRPIVHMNGDIDYVAQPPRAAQMTAWLRAMGNLMVTEGDRRRLALELQRAPAQEGGSDVAFLDDVRQRLSGQPG